MHNTLGSKENPIRCSSLPMLLVCTGFIRLRAMYSDEAGVAATLGTAVGRGIELFHTGTDVGEALKIAKGEATGQGAPMGEKELKDLEKTVRFYAEDPRNGPLALTQVVLESLELELSFEYRGFWFSGHTDQVRRHEDGKLYLWDCKHTKRYSGASAIDAYAAQLAAYAYGCSQYFNEPVGVGGIIRTTGYIGPRSNEKIWIGDRPVFFNANWPEGTIPAILDQCVDRLITMNTITPGAHCGFCPGQGVGNCVRLLK